MCPLYTSILTLRATNNLCRKYVHSSPLFFRSPSCHLFFVLGNSSFWHQNRWNGAITDNGCLPLCSTRDMCKWLWIWWMFVTLEVALLLIVTVSTPSECFWCWHCCCACVHMNVCFPGGHGTIAVHLLYGCQCHCRGASKIGLTDVLPLLNLS